MKKRYINIDIVKRLLNELSDCTLECSGKYSITFNCQMNDEDMTINFDRIVLDKGFDKSNGEISYNSQVYLDNFSGNGKLDNTFLIEELSDDDLERLLQLFDKYKVRKKKIEYARDLLMSYHRMTIDCEGKLSVSYYEMILGNKVEMLIPITEIRIIVPNGRNVSEKPKFEVHLNGYKITNGSDISFLLDDLGDKTIDEVLELLYH